MIRQVHVFTNAIQSQFCFDSSFESVIEQMVPTKARRILLTDQIILKAHHDRLAPFEMIAVPYARHLKTQATVELIIEQLIQKKADKHTYLIGLGGGFISDLTGYVASIYQRGMPFAFVPSTLLGMIDAAIGGKNGIDYKQHKNFIGTIQQPHFVAFDTTLLATLPQQEWTFAFAEIIKYACIQSEELFELLESRKLTDFQEDNQMLKHLISNCVNIKMSIVNRDEQDSGERKKLNFGHTFGHAIEHLYDLSHGEAVAIGINTACKISEKLLNFTQQQRVERLLKRYELPQKISFDTEKILQEITLDKKQNQGTISFILLEAIGQSKIVQIKTAVLAEMIKDLVD